MAVWGVPKGGEQDPFSAVRAGLEMRRGLEDLNRLRAERGQTPIRFGAGIHAGFAISGNIGSDERMEYTVIGDTVNTAARIEASTKAFGTDLLISGEVLDLVKDKFVIEEAGRVEVKGKTDPLCLYRVRGYVEDDGTVVAIRTEFSDFEAGEDAKVKVA
jgi:adenylate cyclase